MPHSDFSKQARYPAYGGMDICLHSLLRCIRTNSVQIPSCAVARCGSTHALPARGAHAHSMYARLQSSHRRLRILVHRSCALVRGACAHALGAHMHALRLKLLECACSPHRYTAAHSGIPTAPVNTLGPESAARLLVPRCPCRRRGQEPSVISGHCSLTRSPMHGEFRLDPARPHTCATVDAPARTPARPHGGRLSCDATRRRTPHCPAEPTPPIGGAATAAASATPSLGGGGGWGQDGFGAVRARARGLHAVSRAPRPVAHRPGLPRLKERWSGRLRRRSC